MTDSAGMAADLVQLPSRRQVRRRERSIEMAFTAHLVTRWRQRVSPDVTRAEAVAEIIEFLRAGTFRPRPRRWTVMSALAGDLFVYSATLPGVCLVVNKRVCVTVVTRMAGRVRLAQARVDRLAYRGIQRSRTADA